MAEQHLRTFFHISDLHFGELDPSGDPLEPDADVKRWWGIHRCCDGFLGHNSRAVRQVEEFFSDVSDAEETTLVVTGDVTACGSAQEFAYATNFLTRTSVFTQEDDFGLRVPDTMTRTIPGNHDSWPGNRTMFGHTNPTKVKVFSQLPLKPSILQLDERRRIILCGIDTDADIDPRSPSRIRGRGHFVSQLDELDRELSNVPKTDDDVVVLLLHHSPMFKGMALDIHRKSLQRLEEAIQRWRISALLTGHIHRPGFTVQRRRDVARSWNQLEARCGTTLQLDELPEKWKPLRLRPVQLERNTVMLHRIFDVDGALEWRTTLYVRGASGFVETQLDLISAVRLT